MGLANRRGERRDCPSPGGVAVGALRSKWGRGRRPCSETRSSEAALPRFLFATKTNWLLLRKGSGRHLPMPSAACAILIAAKDLRSDLSPRCSANETNRPCPVSERDRSPSRRKRHCPPHRRTPPGDRPRSSGSTLRDYHKQKLAKFPAAEELFRAYFLGKATSVGEFGIFASSCAITSCVHAG